MTPCAGKWELFDSVNPAAHKEAAAICATCPAIEWCRRLLAEVQADSTYIGRPTGTWAGELITYDTPKPHRQHRPARCGTEAGYARHRREGTPICDGCREACSAARRLREERKVA